MEPDNESAGLRVDFLRNVLAAVLGGDSAIDDFQGITALSLTIVTGHVC